VAELAFASQFNITDFNEAFACGDIEECGVKNVRVLLQEVASFGRNYVQAISTADRMLKGCGVISGRLP
jgi:hypothetical protein